MQWEIYEYGEIIGTLSAQREGLFFRLRCRVDASPKKLRRVYAMSGFAAIYLGIPDALGLLDTRVACVHFPCGITGAAALNHPRGQWAPWCGELAGVFCGDALLRAEGAGSTLAIPAQAEPQFPAWAGQMEHLTLFAREMALIPIDTDGTILLKETEGEEYEETNAVPDSGACLLCHDAADGVGDADGEKADCPDL